MSDLGALQAAFASAASPLVSQALGRVGTIRSIFLGAVSKHIRETLQPALESMSVGLAGHGASMDRLQKDLRAESLANENPILSDLWSAMARSETARGDAAPARATQVGGAIRAAVAGGNATSSRSCAAAVLSVLILLRACGTFVVSVEGQLQDRKRVMEQKDAGSSAGTRVSRAELAQILMTASSMTQDHTSMAIARLSRWR